MGVGSGPRDDEAPRHVKDDTKDDDRSGVGAPRDDESPVDYVSRTSARLAKLLLVQVDLLAAQIDYQCMVRSFNAAAGLADS